MLLNVTFASRKLVLEIWMLTQAEMLRFFYTYIFPSFPCGWESQNKKKYKNHIMEKRTFKYKRKSIHSRNKLERLRLSEIVPSSKEPLEAFHRLYIEFRKYFFIVNALLMRNNMQKCVFFTCGWMVVLLCDVFLTFFVN